MRIPSGKVDQVLYFVAVDSTDLKTRKTGLSSFTVYRSRNGGAATVYTTPTVAELSAANMPGVYSVLIDEDTTIASTSDSEEYCIHVTQASMAPVTRVCELYRRDTTTGNTLDVTATGAAGIDWGNVENKTTANAFTATTIATTQQVDVNTIKTQAVTCSGGVTVPAATLASTTNITSATGIVLNNGAQSITSLAVSGTTTLTGNVAMQAGLNITQSAANSSALVVTGNGTGHGAVLTSGSGATGDGVQMTAASTAGNGLKLTKTGAGVALASPTTDLVLAKTTNITGFNDIAATAVVSSGAITTSGGAVSSVTTVTGSVGSVVGLTASDVGAIKAKTDSLAFTVAGQVDANIQYVNDVLVTGNGAPGTEWGP